jgi:uncharacterized FlaG/YvyC family protein
MAVEDTDSIKASAGPVKNPVQYMPKKAKADSRRETVSSPAASVEDRTVEKTKAEVRGADTVENNDFSSAVTKDKPLTKSQLEEITEGINRELTFFASSVQFNIEEVETDSPGFHSLSEGRGVKGSAGDMIEVKKKEVIVSVVDKRTGEVIRKIPPEDLLQSLYNASMFVGLIVDQMM